MSSERRIVLPRTLRGLSASNAGGMAAPAPTMPSPAAPAGGAPAGEGRGAGHAQVPLLRADELKLLQRRAFERGRETANQESGGLLAAAARKLTEEASRLAVARKEDRTELREFAVRLACLMTRELVGTLVDADAHDLRGTVDRILEQVLPDLKGDRIVLQVAPDDVGLISSEQLLQMGAPNVKVMPNPELERGSVRVVGDGAEFYSGVSERLESMRERLLEEAAVGGAS